MSNYIKYQTLTREYYMKLFSTLIAVVLAAVTFSAIAADAASAPAAATA